MKTASSPTSAPRPITSRLGPPSLLAALGFAATLSAANLYWAPNNDANGGNGTWSASDLAWSVVSDGTGDLQAWDNITPYDAAFFNRGMAGVVTVDGTVNATRLDFGGTTASSTTSYILSGGTINLQGNGSSADPGSTRSIQSTGNVTIGSDIRVFGDGATGQRRFGAYGGTLAITGDVVNAATGGTQTLSLENWSNGTIKIDGNIINESGSGSTPRVNLIVGGTDSNTVTGGGTNYYLNGNNTGIASTSFLRGTLHLNHSNALGATGALTVRNGSNADTANVLIGTAGVTIGNAITFQGISTTSWVRTIGGEHTSGTATFSGDITLNAFAASGNGSSLRVTSAAGGTTVFSGNITDGSNSVPLLKTGDGIVKFNRAAGMNYDGGTTVSAGTLIVNNTSGSGTGSGAVSVSNGAVLGGNGSVTGDVTLAAGARFSPGDMDDTGASSIGTFATAGSLTWHSNGSASLFFDLGPDASASDRLDIAGAFAKGTGDSFVFEFLGGTVAPGTSVTWTLVTFASTTFADASLFSSNIDGVFALDGDKLTFTVSAIPEPAIIASLLAMLSLAIAGVRRKRT